jgi:hypothetical protein
MNARVAGIFFLIVSFAFLCVPMGRALAVPVNYIETFDGDLPHPGFPLPTLAFDIGVNTVSGRFGVISEVQDDVDSFAFTVPAGAELVAGQVEMFDLDTMGGGDIAHSEWMLRSGSANSNGGTAIELLDPNSPGVDALTFSLPLGPNVYNVTHVAYSSSPPPPAMADYTFTFELRAIVPEPASAALLLAGAIAALCFRRRLD